MRMRLAVQLATVAVCASAIVACRGDRDGNRAQQPLRTQSEAQAQATVSLSGCVEAAPGTDRYVLRNVRFTSQTASDPHRDTTTAGAHGITEGAWVRLVAKGQDLRSRLGERVTISGVITDNGRNTIGTAGTPAVALPPSGDASQAASRKDEDEKYKAEMGRIARESMANGTAAEIRVQQVQGAGEKCNQVNR